jgi:2-polyprenyl-6-methoxyphenol hydroxylase-like FAD-dependent oxidoreductase
MLPQSETERLLEENLAAQGISVERQVELASFVNGEDGVRAVLRHPDGREESVAADWLVGCDGAHSAVRHGLGVPFTGETMDSDWILADVHVQGYPFPDSEAAVFWHRDGVFVIFPISPGRYRLLADLPSSGAAHSPAPTLEQVQALMDRRGPQGMVASDPVWLTGFNINGRKVSRYRWGRTFLAGDAAHIHSPAGGQGMNTGMQDAFNLAWKLALVMHGTCGEDVLDSYSPERSAVGDEVLKAAGRLTAVATLKNPIAQSARNLVGHLLLGLAPVQHAVANTVTELSIGYPATPLNGPPCPAATGRSRGSASPPPPGRPHRRRQCAALRIVRAAEAARWTHCSAPSRGCWKPVRGRPSGTTRCGWSARMATWPARPPIPKRSPRICGGSPRASPPLLHRREAAPFPSLKEAGEGLGTTRRPLRWPPGRGSQAD